MTTVHRYPLGWCAGIEHAELLKEQGYDYIECAATSLDLENEEACREELKRLSRSPLPVETFNLFLPGDRIPAVGPNVDGERLRRYAANAAAAMASVNAKVCVFGSGRARHVPEGWDRARAEEQFRELLGWIADEFEDKGLTLAIEPLNRKETNFINSVKEAVRLAKSVDRPEIQVLADFYHMDEENEPLETLVEHAEWLAHIHVADTGRLAPGTGSYPYAEFADALRRANYRGRVSVEGGSTVSEHGEGALRFMEKAFG